MENNRPEGRKRKIEGTGSGLYRRGEGLNTGPVGKGGGFSPRKGNAQFRETGGGGNYNGKRGGGGLGVIVLLLLLLFGGGGGALSGLFGGGTSTQTQEPTVYVTPSPKPAATIQQPSVSSGITGQLLQGIAAASTQSDWAEPANVETVSGTVASGARD